MINKFILIFSVQIYTNIFSENGDASKFFVGFRSLGYFKMCRGRDSNPHGIAPKGFSYYFDFHRPRFLRGS